MKNAIIIALMWIAISCTSAGDNESNTVAQDDRKPSLRYVMVNKTQCDLVGDHKRTEKNELWGSWSDSLLWKTQPNDSCWYGIQSIDRHISLTLNATNTFVWTETYADSTISYTDYGEYFLSNDSTTTVLVLAKNNSVDSLFAHDDTMHGREFRLFWTDPTRILLQEAMPDRNIRDYEVYELKKNVTPTKPKNH